MDLNELTIKQAHQGLVKKEFSATELCQAAFKKIKEEDQEISAFLTLSKNQALEQAQQVDDWIGAGRDIPLLAGIPIAVKDNILVKDIKCTAGSKILEDYIAPYDATVIRKLKKEQAIILGKTNLDEFAMGGSTENSAFGLTKNPHDLERVPGGSSGGSAAATASNMGLASLGSDTGGSVRQPASFCGVVGLKPTYGAVSRYGLIAMASSLDQIGPITKTVEDARILFDVISGKDQLDSTSLDRNRLKKTAFDSLSDLVIGIPKEYFGEGLDKEVEQVIKNAIKKIEDRGAAIKEISLPHSEYALSTYYIIVPSEVSANLARYDGIKYGEVEPAENLKELYLKTRGKKLGEEVRRRIMLGTYALSSGYYQAYYKRAQKVRTLIKDDFEQAFEEVDLILSPTTPTPAFKIGEKIEDPLAIYLFDVYTVSVNLAALPAISIPIEKIPAESKAIDGLPVGLQLIGNSLADYEVLESAQLIEASLSKP